MPYYSSYRRYPRSFGRYIRYYGRRYSSANKIRTTRNVRASAQNMTQGGKFTITAHDVKSLEITQGNTGTGAAIELPTLVRNSSMHRNLSNVFDQYRIEKLTIKIRDAGTSTANGYTTTMLPVICSIVDRTGLAGGLDLDQMRTYSSYKETLLSANNDISPTHTVYIGASTIVESSEYFDTKQLTTFPKVYVAVVLPSAVANSGDAEHPYSYTRQLSIDVEAQVRYRGVRLDPTVIN